MKEEEREPGERMKDGSKEKVCERNGKREIERKEREERIYVNERVREREKW